MTNLETSNAPGSASPHADDGNQGGASALPPARDILRADFGAEKNSVYEALKLALVKNVDWSVKTGPSNAFHNHNAAWLVAAYRIGSDKAELDDIVSDERNKSKIRVDVAGDQKEKLTITANNWKNHLGKWNGREIGLYGLKAEQNFQAYAEFFRNEIAKRGVHGDGGVLAIYLPTLAKGLAGDFFHAVIELGYFFESKEEILLMQGLAWIAVAYVEIPGAESGVDAMSPSGNDNFARPTEALSALSRVEGGNNTVFLRQFNLNDGSSGYIDDIEALINNEASFEKTCEYDFDFTNMGETQLGCMLNDIQTAACDSFAAGGCVDFYTLHSVTGARAVWAIFGGISGNVASVDGAGNYSAPWVVNVKRSALSALWRAILFTHVARNNPQIKRSGVFSWDAGETLSTDSLTPWAELNAKALETKNEHIIKVVFSLADFYDREVQNPELWCLADRVMHVREGKNSGLVGVGVGSRLQKFIDRIECEEKMS